MKEAYPLLLCRKCGNDLEHPAKDPEECGNELLVCKCNYVTGYPLACTLGARRVVAAQKAAEKLEKVNHTVESLLVDLDFQKQVNVASEAARVALMEGILKSQAEIERLRLLVDQQTRLLEEVKPNFAKMEGNEWFARRDAVLKNKGHLKPQS